MSLEKAYCEEFDEIIDIFEAHHRYFAQPEENRQPFVFRCADEACRRQKNPLIKAINYWKSPDEWQRRPHFSIDKSHPHISGCPLAEIDVAKHQLEEEAKLVERKTRIKRNAIVAIFLPPEDGAEEDLVMGIEIKRVNEIRNTPNLTDRVNAYKTELQTTAIKSRYLSEVVSCFESMSEDERRTASLVIGKSGKQRSYRQIFKSTRYCEAEKNDFIFYGTASVHAFASGYAIRFLTKPEDGPQVSIFIRHDRLALHRADAELAMNLKTRAEQDNLCRCYVHGEVTNQPPSKDGQIRLDITPAHLSLLVLRDST